MPDEDRINDAIQKVAIATAALSRYSAALIKLAAKCEELDKAMRGPWADSAKEYMDWALKGED